MTRAASVRKLDKGWIRRCQFSRFHVELVRKDPVESKINHVGIFAIRSAVVEDRTVRVRPLLTSRVRSLAFVLAEVRDGIERAVFLQAIYSRAATRVIGNNRESAGPVR